MSGYSIGLNSPLRHQCSPRSRPPRRQASQNLCHLCESHTCRRSRRQEAAATLRPPLQKVGDTVPSRPAPVGLRFLLSVPVTPQTLPPTPSFSAFRGFYATHSVAASWCPQRPGRLQGGRMRPQLGRGAREEHPELTGGLGWRRPESLTVSGLVRRTSHAKLIFSL
uniref:Uncharacterized protein n=1 Tax=Molossus molossus TaxID=27622 RepID=A0A7J8CS05_MOLMO|nr:hypothetical protein HJG59_009834 [Molossus molossus]